MSSASPTPELRAAGWNLIELAIVGSLLAILAGLAVPPLFRLSGELRADLGAAELVAALRSAQTTAVRLDRQVAVKFRTLEDRRVTFTLYRDGDGDGILNHDIDSGVDPELVPARTLAHLGGHLGLGFPAGRPPRDPGDPRRRLDRLDDPIRFNRSDLASFSPLGGSTPGSLYLTDGDRCLRVVRVLGRTGRIRVQRWDPTADRWEK